MKRALRFILAATIVFVLAGAVGRIVGRNAALSRRAVESESGRSNSVQSQTDTVKRPLEELIPDSASGEQLYRNREYHFRIRFPAGWIVKNGDGPNIRKKAVDGKGATLLVLAKDATTSEGIADFRKSSGELAETLTDAEVKAGLEKELDWRELQLSDYPDPREGLKNFSDVDVLESGLRRLDNRTAFFSRVRVSYSVGDRTVRAEHIQYSLWLSGRFYQVQGGAPLEQIAALQPVLNRSVHTFVIETW